MSPRTASTLVIGVLAAAACLLTAFLVPVPVWVLFVGWASFFAAGGGVAGLARSLGMNLIGMLVAALVLVVITASAGNAWILALSVGIGAAVLVALGRVESLSATPAGFLGFAATFGFFATGATLVQPFGFGYPLVLLAVAFVLGALSGSASEVLSRAISQRIPAVTRSRAVGSVDG